jgi:hypothetical protein
MRDRNPAVDGNSRLTVIDLAETAGIPVAKARRLIMTFGNDAKTLLSAVNEQRPASPRPKEHIRI